MTARVSVLANGLRVVSEANDRVETVALGVWVDVGTRHEAAAVNGVSHLLEHMAFKGTQRRSARAIAEEIEAVGGHLNAYTSRENTAYFAQVLKEDLPLAVDILSDILQNSVFDEAELARERAVVLQEIGQAEDTPDDIVFDHFQATAYPDQALGRSVLGAADIIAAMERGTLIDYMRAHYRAPAMVLAAAGNLDHDRLVALADAAFGGLEGDAPPAPPPARYGGGETRRTRRLEQVHLVLGLPGVSFTDPDYDALSVLSTMLGGGMSSRLFQELREERGLVYSVYSFVAAYRDGGLFGVYAGTGEAEAAELMPVLCDEIARAAAAPTAAELDRVKAQLKAALVMSLESTAGRCEQLARQIQVYGRILPMAELVGRIEAVDAAALARAAARLQAGPPTLAALGPVGRLPGLDDIAARLAA